MSEPLTRTAVSCPAKVLVAGGYLVLDRAYTGLVFGLDARIHTVVEPLKTTAGVSISEIVVTSPQFHGAIWEYGYRSQEGDGGIAVTQLSVGHEQSISASKNPFIETALTFALTYIWTLQPNQRIASCSIRILADQAYYSNPGTRRAADSRFLDFNVSLKHAHKTGLGSSAALVTSFTAAVLSFYLPKSLFDLQSDKGQTILHNLSQASHSHAQGKVGSGFDIASAVFGSCLYKRFSPSLLNALPPPSSPGFADQLRSLIEGDAWDTEIRKAAIKMPQGLRLVMCDVDCGSETPSMVKKVLAWRQENKEEAERIWNELQRGNEALAAELTRLAGADLTAGEGNDKLRAIIQKNRGLIRQMGEASGVPIEPPQQTQLLDYCSTLDGVIGGVVPGAGGYDAVVLLVQDKEEVIASLRKSLASYRAEDSEEGLKIGKVGIIGVREEMVGVRKEELSLYKEWPTTS
ncbi:Phosphomevalonate kinase [Cucurbitaria berberidis CBS 394.84]|uniref:Phosphomevalonate kinase n=1 Tax=Cucurbitaria berberidis CBS 394.84 TaxID=1168544 RepID=A0A9P4G856_9PLEO|nr:Phosphomevalonate kinase [Cucurbitaria berberidis CBS 394.84]KAF1840764.1 Phosphomevalonate kinase [Cucurbitaria berberidis CBS 394.84]